MFEKVKWNNLFKSKATVDKKYKLGLVLSGGGAKCLAHIGVLYYLKELGIQPDVVAATSGGSMVGGMYASGTSLGKIQDFFHDTDLFQWNNSSFWKHIIKFKGIVDTINFAPKLKEKLIHDDFSKTKMDLFVVATDMENAKEKVFHSGSISQAVLASSAYPFIFTPVEIDGITYSDGGILNHFPLDVIRDQCEYVIGVYVSPIRTYGKEDLQNAQQIAYRAMSLKGDKAELQKLNQCDIAIFPQELTKFSTFDTQPDKLYDIVDIGYREADKHKEALYALRKKLTV
ncbi:patatin-like phospholipase family protein [Flammeovirga yaeyamensis]|uniref:Patatin-like phospholipase family protein n=1 Tax=Flammeovirga yaeyamensis TaxID=367791 RepID=A0AAX1N171_9BACT|nr:MULTISPECIES: patatin-like phospholipase family protein [Flammeovirga]ANQ51275.1 patatin-like phospholipase family protein [Flammeovirga sp. MY04]MBB3698330.1 NTE family protein [Flammeovirga yaeyamensis]NMF34317.1 patatin-like phospholipase family protein [Flammeovirga yaeyamensis]QWG01300.1 patatin-like phospholipase family protein [Flammeovirga yaeyamensis]